MMMQAGLLTGQPRSYVGRAGKKGIALCLMVVGVASVTLCLTFYATGPAPLTSAVISFATNSPAVEWVESRAGGWNDAADGIIAKLKAANVKRGQIISIDAHNNGNAGDAIFSAYFVRSWPDNGALDISYTAQNTKDYGWMTFYKNAAQDSDETDIISITGSNNVAGRSVMYKFSYAPPAIHRRLKDLGVVEMRAGGWDPAAKGIIAKLSSEGLQRGQVISIDAHNNDENGDAIFSALFDRSLPGYGPLDISYRVQNNGYSWAAHYNTAGSQATTGVIDITSSVNSGGNSVTFVFNNQ